MLFIKEAPFGNEISHVSNAADIHLPSVAWGHCECESCRVPAAARDAWFTEGSRCDEFVTFVSDAHALALICIRL